jgi:ubiquinone biosynthesis protein UbiJ
VAFFVSPPPAIALEPALESPFAAALNHLLDAEPGAREKLLPFAGAIVELRCAALPRLRFSIDADGWLHPAGAGAAALVLNAGPQVAAALWRGEEHWPRTVKAEGDPRLADTLFELARHLRWDAEEDLSRFVGDIAAHRLARAARSMLAWQRDAARRIGEAASDYLADEKRVLVRRVELDELASGVAGLRDALERLDKRLQRLG